MTHEEPTPPIGDPPPFRGIIPFAGSLEVSEDDHGKVIKSSSFQTAAGNMQATIGTVKEIGYGETREYQLYPWLNSAYAIDKDGSVSIGKPSDFLGQGFGELNINFDNILDIYDQEELEKKGSYNSLVQVTDDLILRGYFDLELSSGVGFTMFDSFTIENQEGSERKLLMFHPDNPLVKKMAVSIVGYIPAPGEEVSEEF